MARYYEESALLEFVKKYTPTIGGETTMECVERAIRNSPTADVVEVVRCKDCIRAKMYAFGCDNTERLACVDINESGEIAFAQAVEENHFCSYGERKA